MIASTPCGLSMQMLTRCKDFHLSQTQLPQYPLHLFAMAEPLLPFSALHHGGRAAPFASEQMSLIIPNIMKRR